MGIDTSFKNAKTALLLGAYTSTKDKPACEDNLNELERLCDTYGLQAVAKIASPIKKIDAGTFLGSGKLDEMLKLSDELGADVILFDDEISPNQQRNLEKLFQRPVIDRTELIIEVFAQRAQTREARLQVELAKVKYQLPRLKRLWTHLSRQAGSGGGGGSGGAYLRGEGETQIELDRRMLKQRVLQLQKEIKVVEKQRETQRRQRLRTGIPTFAIVGYTNAGKSTLLNALTKADVFVEDKLFATLDTTTRKFILPNRQEILLVDTVGFIRKIPHMLVTAFKSTLEEAVHTDILLHLVDVSNPQAELQAEATMHVLKELKADQRPIITVLNKIDACQDPGILHRFRLKYPKTVQISALTGQGFDHLMELMVVEIGSLRKTYRLRIPQSHYSLVSELMREGKVLQCDYEDNDILLHVEVPGRFESKVKPFIYEFA
ncbi:MAG TPA: GTPase HflX [Rhabdochlamydiaceae bacterium]|nr:GTPase HflX [Rhabdochlamydiaceae bacterium]